MGPWPSKDRAAGFGVMQYIRCVGWLIGWLMSWIMDGCMDGATSKSWDRSPPGPPESRITLSIVDSLAHRPLEPKNTS